MISELTRTADGRRISYAQNGEDIVLLRAFEGQPTGFWIDVGANHPVHDSVTKNFSDLGWTGINIEPVADFYEELVACRPDDINICAAVSDRSGVMVFHQNDSNRDLSTFDDSLEQIYRERGDSITDVEVDVVRLEHVCASHVNAPVIDFLKVDTEGHELAVLAGHDFQRFPVRAVCAEATEARLGGLVTLMEAVGMVHICFDGLNAWFAREAEQDTLGLMLARPPSPVLDWYHPAVYLSMLDERDERIAAQQRRLDELEALPTTVRAASVLVARGVQRRVGEVVRGLASRSRQLIPAFVV